MRKQWEEAAESSMTLQEWWKQRVVGQGGLSGMGIGKFMKERWGWTWWKPSHEELHQESMRELLLEKFQTASFAELCNMNRAHHNTESLHQCISDIYNKVHNT